MGLELSSFIPFPQDTVTLKQIRRQWNLVREIYNELFAQGQASAFLSYRIVQKVGNPSAPD